MRYKTKVINIKRTQRNIYSRQSVEHLKPFGNYIYYRNQNLKNLRSLHTAHISFL